MTYIYFFIITGYYSCLLQCFMLLFFFNIHFSYFLSVFFCFLSFIVFASFYFYLIFLTNDLTNIICQILSVVFSVNSIFKLDQTD